MLDDEGIFSAAILLVPEAHVWRLPLGRCTRSDLRRCEAKKPTQGIEAMHQSGCFHPCFVVAFDNQPAIACVPNDWSFSTSSDVLEERRHFLCDS